MVGGKTLFRTAKTDAASSTAPAAPSRCPVMDFVELMQSRRACSPKTVWIAIVSYLSLSGVEVPWALM